MFKGLITYPDDDDDDNRVIHVVGLLDLGNFKRPGQLENIEAVIKKNYIYISITD
jgi:hypothetical protein